MGFLYFYAPLSARYRPTARRAARRDGARGAER
jgi:hypothetical protein